MNNEMLSNHDRNTVFQLLSLAKQAIEGADLPLARDLIKNAAAIEIDNPAVYNVLAISYESENDYVKASKFYRVAYYLDQNFKAAERNLARVCSFGSKQTGRVEWGLEDKR